MISCFFGGQPFGLLLTLKRPFFHAIHRLHRDQRTFAWHLSTPKRELFWAQLRRVGTDGKGRMDKGEMAKGKDSALLSVVAWCGGLLAAATVVGCVRVCLSGLKPGLWPRLEIVVGLWWVFAHASDLSLGRLERRTSSRALSDMARRGLGHRLAFASNPGASEPVHKFVAAHCCP